MLELHAQRSAAIFARAARVALVVEAAAGGDARVAALRAQMTRNLLLCVGLAWSPWPRVGRGHRRRRAAGAVGAEDVLVPLLAVLLLASAVKVWRRER